MYNNRILVACQLKNNNEAEKVGKGGKYMAWGNASKSKAKSKPASKTKAKKVKKKYSLNDRYSYHFNKYHDNDYSKGYVTGIEIGKPDNLENKSVSFQQGNKNARMAKIKIQDIKF